VDVHKKTVVACVLLTEAEAGVRKHVRTFATMTADRLALSDWVSACGVTQVAMERPGISWRPVVTRLEEDERPQMLVNPQHLRAVPGRNTDGKDRAWLADAARAMGWCSRALSRRLPSARCAS
jgi:transposase